MAKHKWLKLTGLVLASHLILSNCQNKQETQTTPLTQTTQTTTSSSKKKTTPDKDKDKNKDTTTTTTTPESTDKAIPGVTVPTSDGFILTENSVILSRTKDGIVVDHNGHSHFIFYSDLLGTKFAYLIPAGVTVTTTQTVSEQSPAQPASSGDHHYVFDPADIVAEDANGYTVRHGDHYHYILKSSLTGPYSQTNSGTGAVTSPIQPTQTTPQSPIASIPSSGLAGIDYPTSDGFLFDGTGVSGWTDLGLLVNHNGHLHLLLTGDLARSKWSYLLTSRPDQAPTPTVTSPDPSDSSSFSQPAQPVVPVKDEVAEKRAYLARETGNAETAIKLIDTPNGQAFMYPHDDHYHIVLLSHIDVTRPFDDGHRHDHTDPAEQSDNHEHQDDTHNHDEQENFGDAQSSDQETSHDHGADQSATLDDSDNQAAPTDDTDNQDSGDTTPMVPIQDEVAVKRAYLAAATGLSESEISLLDTPDGPAFMYPHGDHHHVILLSQIDVAQTFDDGHGNHDHTDEGSHHDNHEEPDNHHDEQSESDGAPSSDQESNQDTHMDDGGTAQPETSSDDDNQAAPTQNLEPQDGGEATPPTAPTQPIVPNQDDVAVKRAYLASATGLSESEISLLNTPDGPAFMYPHGDHYHVVLLSQLDINQPFNDGHSEHDDESTPSNHDESDDIEAKIAEKVAAIMRQYGLKREDIVVDKAKNAIIYPHGNHFHADPIDPKKPHSGGHSHSDEEIFDPEDGVAEKTDHKVLTGKELAKAIQLLQANTFNNQAFTVDRGQKRVSFIFNDSIIPQLGTNVRVTLTTPDGKVFEKLSGHVFGEGAANLANFELDKPYLPGQIFSYTIASKDYPEVSYSGRFAVNASPAYDLARGVTFEPFYAGDGSVRLHATRPVLPGTEALVRLFDDFHGAPYLENNYQTGSIELAIPELNKGTTQLPGNTIPVVFIVNPYELNESSYVIELPVLDRQTAGSDVFQPLEPGEDGLDDTVDQPSMEVLQDKLLALAQKYGVGLDSLIFHPDGRVELRLPDGTYLPVDMASLIAEAATEQETPPTKPGIAGIDYPTSDGFLFDGTGMAGWTSAGLLVNHNGHTHILPTEAIANSKWAHLLPKAEEVTSTVPVELSEQLTKQRDDLAKQLGLNVEDIRVVTADGKVVGFEYPHEDHYDFVPANTSDGGSTELTEQDKRELTAYIRKTYGLLMGTPVTFHDDFVVFAIPHPHQDYDATRDYYSDVLDPQYDPGHVHPYAVPLSHLTVPVSTGIAELDFENELLLAAKRIGVAPSEVKIKDKKYFVLPGKDHDHYLNILTPVAGLDAYMLNKLPDIKANFAVGDYSEETVVTEADRVLVAAKDKFGDGTVEFRRVARALEAFKANLTVAMTSTEAYLNALHSFEKRYVNEEVEADTGVEEKDTFNERYAQLVEQLKGFSDRTLQGYHLNRDGVLSDLKSSVANRDDAAVTALESVLKAVARVEGAPSDLGPRLAYMDYFLRQINDLKLTGSLRERMAEKILELYQTARVFRPQLSDTVALKNQVKTILATSEQEETNQETGSAYRTLMSKYLEIVNYVNGFRDFLLKGHGMSDEEKADGFTEPLSLQPATPKPTIPNQPTVEPPVGQPEQPALGEGGNQQTPPITSDPADSTEVEDSSLTAKVDRLTAKLEALSPEVRRTYRVPLADWKTALAQAAVSEDSQVITRLTSYLAEIERIEQARAQNPIGSRVAHLDYFLRHIDKPYVSSTLRERMAQKILYLHTADSYEYQAILFEVIDMKAALQAEILANQTHDVTAGTHYAAFLAERSDIIDSVNYRRQHLLARGFITEAEKAEGFTENLPLP